jgi:hypothetical protein
MTRGKTRNWLPDADADVFRRQHQLRTTGEREINGARRSVLLNEAESPLGWLKSQKDRGGKPLISEPQFDAGERLRSDYWFAHMPLSRTIHCKPLHSASDIQSFLDFQVSFGIVRLHRATPNLTIFVAHLLPRGIECQGNA